MTVKTKSRVSRSHEDATIESFRKDPAFAAEYLNSILEDGDQEELMLALRRMSKAFGGVQKLAGQAKLNTNKSPVRPVPGPSAEGRWVLSAPEWPDPAG